MNQGNVEFGEVTMSYSNTAYEGSRIGRISQMTFEYLQQLIERDMQQIGADLDVDRVTVPPIVVSFETMSDEEIARTSAERILQALMEG